MPLLDIATPQPSFRKQLYSTWSQRIYHVSFVLSNDNTTRLNLGSSWRCFHKSNNLFNFNRGTFEACGGVLVIKAVATLEPRCFHKENGNVQQQQQQQVGIDSLTTPPPTHNQSSSEDLDERERLRRMRISKANKGNTPWNKGRKHSPETLQRIRERTRIAMQDPKVKMKLVNLGHAQSDETRTKIGVSVRLGWERRREKQMVQETCHFEWLNLIAEASRKGLNGEEELQWDSYNIMDEQLKKEWIESVEQRKKSKPKGSKRAPKSPEQRRKISEAIAAKWADPSYRNRVYSGLSKYHGTTVGIAKPRSDRKTKPSKKKSKDLDTCSGKSKSIQSKLKRSNRPMYKDPQANSKLEMIKSIRAQRAASETTKVEAITRARLLIAEAERAADALEAAAAKSRIAQSSLIETRKLIAEAIRFIESTDTVTTIQSPDESDSGKSEDGVFEGPSKIGYKGVNGVEAVGLSDAEMMEFGFSKQDDDDDDDDDVISRRLDDEHVLVNGKEHIHISSSSTDFGLVPLEMNNFENEGDEKISTSEVESEKHETRPNTRTKTKRWVCGKLVEDD